MLAVLKLTAVQYPSLWTHFKCSSTVQFCLIQLAKLFGKNKEKKNSFCQSVVVYTNYFGVASEEISGVKTCQCGATHCDDPL